MKKALILGGTGLVGEEIVKQLGKENYQIDIVSLGSEADRDSFTKLKKLVPNLQNHITGNVFLPNKYKDKTFNELVESDLFLEDYLKLLYLKPNYKEYFLYEVLKETKPDIVIDAINSATVLSYTKNTTLIQDYLIGKEVKLETLLTTFSIPRLINFFDCLYKSLKEFDSIKMFLKVGTTGTGGMGFNIPYTHGENKPSVPLLEKAAISGAYTSLLYLLSQTFGLAEIKEVKPAALVGYKNISYDKIKLGRSGSKSLKVYKFDQIQKLDLTKTQKLDFDGLGFKEPEEDFRAVFVDTGENGQFSQEEFRTISNSKQMGFITNEEIADIVSKEIKGIDSGKEILKTFAETVLGPSQKGQQVREKVLNEMTELATRKKIPSLAFEILGPPRLAKLIFEAYLIKKLFGFESKKLTNTSISEKDLEKEDVSLIISTGIPILTNQENLIIGKKPKTPKFDEEINQENIDNWAESGWVDLRDENINKWVDRLEKYFKTNKSLEIGDIVAWIFEIEDKGFRK